MKKICLMAGLILSMVSNEVTAQSTASAQAKHGFVPLAHEVVVIQSKATVKTLTGTWKVPAGGAFRIRVTAKGARASDRSGVAAEPGDIVSGEFVVYSGQVLHYSVGRPGPTGGDARVYIDDGHQMITAAGGLKSASPDGNQHGSSKRSSNTGINQKIIPLGNFSAGEVTVSILAVCSTACDGGGGGGGGGGCTGNPVAGTLSMTAGSSVVCSTTNSTTFSVSGYNGSIQWESSTDNSPFTPIANETGTTYTATDLNQTTYFRVAVTDGTCVDHSSSPMAVTVNSSLVAGTIAGDLEVCAGGTANLSLSGYTDGASIQWQSSSGGASFNNIDGATSASYAAVNITTATYYQAVVTGCSQSATAPSFEVTIIPTLNPGTLSGGATVCPNTNSTLLTLTGATDGATIEWDSSTDNQTFFPISGATGATNTATDLSGTSYYHVKVSNQCGFVSTSTVQVNVTAAAQAGTISGGGVNVCAGTNSTTLTVNGFSGSSIQWYSSADNSQFDPIPNATGTTYSATNLSTTTYYKASVTNACGSKATTNAAQISVDPLLVWVQDEDNDGHYVGQPVSACSSPGNGYVTLTNQQPGDCAIQDNTKWQSQLLYIDSDGDKYDNGQQQVCYGLTIPDGYRTTTLGQDCNDTDPNVHGALIPGNISGGGVFVCPGTNTTLTLSGNSSGTIQWQSSSNNTTFNNISGQAGQTYPANNVTSTTYYRAVISAGTCRNATTSVAIKMGTLQNATALSTTNITSSGATLNWISSYNPGQWQVEYKSTTPGSKWMGQPLQNGSVRSWRITGLQANQSYQWHIRASCNKSWTSYSVAITFKTLSSTTTATGTSGNVSMLLARLQLKVLPNPTNTNFTISVQGNGQNDAVKLVVLDMYGRIMEEKILSNQQTIILGDKYRPGVYIVRVLQGDQSHEIKIIKLPN